jgi:uncharacterized membrane protein
MKQKSIYQDANTNTTITLIAVSVIMLGLSIYLTQHYFDIKYPTGLEGKSLCNINSFFNCDKTTFSQLSNIAGVPTSLFGAIIGFLALMGLVIRNEAYERTMFFTSIINALGCGILFLYSLFILNGLCPFCTFYYIASGILVFLFYKKSENYKPNLGYLAGFAVITLLASLVVRNTVQAKEKAKNEIGSDLIKQYYSLPNLGTPSMTSDFKLANMPTAPIKIVIFSDFECPACKALSDIIPKVTSRYEGKIDIQYFFYPLDSSCNPSMERPLHKYACKAAYIAICMPPAEFTKVHDVLFHGQEKFSEGFLDTYIKEKKLEKLKK